MASQDAAPDGFTLPQAGDTIGDKYVVDAVLGEGGMGVVFSARHKVTDKLVAVKWMLPEIVEHEGGVERFIREAQVAGRVSHPNVVDIYDVGQDRGSFYLVMEFLRGHSLRDVLDDNTASVDELLGYLVGACRGIGAAHAQGILHRDLKPDNIFICDSPDGYGATSAKVLDFGVSKVLHDSTKRATRLTQTGTVLGTPFYMSPEQARGRSDLDLRSDVHAMGTVAFECFTGRVPFDADTYNALIVKIATEQPPRARGLNPRIPEDLEAAILKAMEPNRDARFPNIEAFHSELQRIRNTIDDEIGGARPDGVRPSLLYSATHPSSDDGYKSGVSARGSEVDAAQPAMAESGARSSQSPPGRDDEVSAEFAATMQGTTGDDLRPAEPEAEATPAQAAPEAEVAQPEPEAVAAQAEPEPDEVQRGAAFAQTTPSAHPAPPAPTSGSKTPMIVAAAIAAVAIVGFLATRGGTPDAEAEALTIDGAEVVPSAIAAPEPLPMGETAPAVAAPEPEPTPEPEAPATAEAAPAPEPEPEPEPEEAKTDERSDAQADALAEKRRAERHARRERERRAKARAEAEAEAEAEAKAKAEAEAKAKAAAAAAKRRAATKKKAGVKASSLSGTISEDDF